MKTKWNLLLALCATAAVAATLTGCDTLDGNLTGTRHFNSSLYAYLYPGQNGHVDEPTVPVLSLPLRVGIAFVPPDKGDRENGYQALQNPVLAETQKIALMKQIAVEFKAYPFVKSIEVIPTTYLTPRGGFANLEQIRTMYDVDVMVLLSYDQVQFTGEGLLSLSYWTVVGAYAIPGEKNETKTMLDAAVYDIASHKMLFRAPGIGEVSGAATPINLSEQLRKNSECGFEQATTNLTANLQAALADFKERVTNAPTEYKIQYKPGYTGAGAFGGASVILMGGLGIGFLGKRHEQKRQQT